MKAWATSGISENRNFLVFKTFLSSIHQWQTLKMKLSK